MSQTFDLEEALAQLRHEVAETQKAALSGARSPRDVESAKLQGISVLEFNAAALRFNHAAMAVSDDLALRMHALTVALAGVVLAETDGDAEGVMALLTIVGNRALDLIGEVRAPDHLRKFSVETEAVQ